MERHKVLLRLASLRKKKERKEREAKLLAELQEIYTPPGPAAVDVASEEMEALLSPQKEESTVEEENLYYKEMDDSPRGIGFETPAKSVAPRNYTFDLYRQKGMTPTLPYWSDKSSNASVESNNFVPRTAKPRSNRTIDMYKQKGVNPTVFPRRSVGISKPNFQQHEPHDSASTKVACGSNVDNVDGSVFRASRTNMSISSVAYSNASTPYVDCLDASSPYVDCLDASTPYVDFLDDFNPFSFTEEEATPTSYQNDLLRSELVPTPFFQDHRFYSSGTPLTQVGRLVYSNDKNSAKFPRSAGSASNKENMAPVSMKKSLPNVSHQVNQDLMFPPLELCLHSIAEQPTYVPMEWLNLYVNRPKLLDKEDVYQDWLQEVVSVARQVPKLGTNPNRAYI